MLGIGGSEGRRVGWGQALSTLRRESCTSSSATQSGCVGHSESVRVCGALRCSSLSSEGRDGAAGMLAGQHGVRRAGRGPEGRRRCLGRSGGHSWRPEAQTCLGPKSLQSSASGGRWCPQALWDLRGQALQVGLCPPRDSSGPDPCTRPSPVTKILFGGRVFADDLVKMSSGWALRQQGWSPCEKGTFGCTGHSGVGRHVKTEAGRG